MLDALGERSTIAAEGSTGVDWPIERLVMLHQMEGKHLPRRAGLKLLSHTPLCASCAGIRDLLGHKASACLPGQAPNEPRNLQRAPLLHRLMRRTPTSDEGNGPLQA